MKMKVIRIVMRKVIQVMKNKNTFLKQILGWNKKQNLVSDESTTEESEILEDNREKYLIFSTGSKTYTPHQVGFKRIKNVRFPKRLDPGPSLQERIAERDRKRELQNSGSLRQEPNWLDYDSVADKFDKVDHLIDLHGHIIGMGLSPDHR